MISIAMTTFNGEKYLQEQIDSILNQSFTDFELIICDDCSTDSSVTILRSYADARIKLFINDKNLGFKKNFEKAISLCSGEYIALADQDDIWEKNHLSLLYENIENYNLICGDNDLVDESGSFMGMSFFQSHLLSQEKFPTNKDILLKVLLSGGCFQGASMLLKKSFVISVLPIPDGIVYHDLWFSVHALMQNSLKVFCGVVTKYRQHNLQVTRKKNQTEVSRINILDYLNKDSMLMNMKEINEIKLYFEIKESKKNRIKLIPIWSKYYKYIYPDNLQFKKIIRCIKFLLIKSI